MLYSCTHMATVGVKGLNSNNAEHGRRSVPSGPCTWHPLAASGVRRVSRPSYRHSRLWRGRRGSRGSVIRCNGRHIARRTSSVVSPALADPPPRSSVGGWIRRRDPGGRTCNICTVRSRNTSASPGWTSSTAGSRRANRGYRGIAARYCQGRASAAGRRRRRRRPRRGNRPDNR